MRILTYIMMLLLLVAGACSKKVTDVVEPEVTSQMPDQVEKKMTPKIGDESFRANAPEAGAAPKVNIAEAQSFVLDNGLKVLVVENHKIPQVSFQLRLINDPIREFDKVGSVDMTGQILSRGTTNRSKVEIDDAVDFIGGILNTSGTGIFARSLTKHKEALLDVMTDVLYNPSFEAEQLEKIKVQMRSALQSAKTSPNSLSANARAKVLFGEKHPYGEVMEENDLESITADNLKAYYKGYFSPSNAYLIIVGDMDLKEAKKVSEKYFASWSGPMVKRPGRRTVPVKKGKSVHFVPQEGAVQSTIVVANAADLKPGHPDAIAVRLMNTILGGGFSSRLVQNLREDKAYTYGAYSSLRTDPVTSTFLANTSVRNEVSDSAVTQLLFELERIQNTLVDEKELSSLKNYLMGNFSQQLESPQTIANFAYAIERYNLPANYYQTYLEKLSKVSAEDVQRVAQKYIDLDNASIIVVGNKDEVAKKLMVFDADETIDYYDPFGNVINVEAKKIPKGVTAESVIKSFLKASGGLDKIKDLQHVTTKMEADMMGQKMIMETFQKGGEKFAMKIGNGQLVFQEQAFDGKKVVMKANGQKQEFTEGPVFDELNQDAQIIPQQNYFTGVTKLELVGLDNVNDQEVYKINVITPKGKHSEYYDITNSLLIRTIKTNAVGVIVTSDFGDYQAQNGIMFPHKASLTGMLPNGAAIVMKIVSLDLTTEIPDDMFILD